MSPVCHIVCAGDFDKECFLPHKGDFVIACDAGLEYLHDCGVVPDLVVGDFDSLKDRPQGENIVRLPREKDDTDSAYALKEGFARGFKRFILHGALGGARLSHTAANVTLLLYLRERGAEGILCGKNTCAGLLVNGCKRFSPDERGYLSVFALFSPCEVALKNLKFSYSGMLEPSFPLGVSNEFTGGQARIEAKDGTLLWICEGKQSDPARFFER